MSTSGERLKEARLKAGYNLRELSQITGISKATLSRYENNGLDNVSIDKMKTIASALKIPVENLLDYSNKIEYDNQFFSIKSSKLKETYSRALNNLRIKSIIDNEINKSRIIESISYKVQTLNNNGLKNLELYLNFISSLEEMTTNDNFYDISISTMAQNLIKDIKDNAPNATDEDLYTLLVTYKPLYDKLILSLNSHSDKE